MVTGVYFALLRVREVEPPGDWFLAVFGSTSLLVFIGAIRKMGVAIKDKQAFHRAETGASFEDGQGVAAIGRIGPVDKILKTPFQQKECVAYEYEVFSRVRSGSSSNESPDFSGFALTSSVIRAPQGNVRLLSYAMLNHFEKHEVESIEEQQNATAYHTETIFEDMDIKCVSPFKVFSAIADILSDDDGMVRKDWCVTDQELVWSDCDLSERFVGVGEQVCALGIYSAEKGGLVPQWNGKNSVNRLFPGDGKTVIKNIFNQALFALVFGVFFSL